MKKRTLRFVDDGKKVWWYSSMRVQYLAGLALFLWSQIPKEFQDFILQEVRSTGLSNRGMVLAAAIIWLLANIGTRITKYEKAQGNGTSDQSAD